MTSLRRRQFLRLAAGVAALPAMPRPARAQAYPTRPIRLLVGFAAGGGTDLMARLIQQGLSERLGQQIVVEECTYDRSLLSHKVNLFDLHHKYADVMHLEEVIAHLDGLARGRNAA